MPRTLSAQLESAFDTLNFNPYIRIHVGTDNGATTETYLYTIQPISYKIGALHAEFSCEVFTTDIDEIQTFYIERGAYIGGTPDTVKSAVFAVNSLIFDGRIMHVKGDLMPKENGVIVGYQSYHSAIDSVLSNAAISVGTLNYEGTPAWKNYKFLPSTRNINNPEYFFSLLQQKYLIFIFEDGHTTGAESFNSVGVFCATDARTQDYTITDKLFKFETGTTARQFIWRDEAGTIHTSGSAKLIHNLGYLESTDSPPTNTASPLPGSKAIVPIHLKYQRGDYVTINSGDGETREYTGRIDVVEILDTKHEPSWYCEITPLVHFTNTEGGALPSTIERVAAYTPLVTTNFNNNLDQTVNNLQAFADRVDELELTSEEQLFAILTALGVKTTLVDDDYYIILDSEDDYALKVAGHDDLKTYIGAGGGGLTYTPTTVTTSNVTAQSGKLYALTIAGMTAERDFNLPTPGAAGETIAALILDGDDEYELVLKANSVEIDRVYIKNDYVEFVSTGTGAGDWEIKVDGIKPATCLISREAAQSISTGSFTRVDVDTAVNRGFTVDLVTNHEIIVRRDGTFELPAMTSIAGLDDQEFLDCQVYINGSALSSASNWISYSGTNVAQRTNAPVRSFPLSKGDTIRLYIRHNEGASQNTLTAASFGSPFLWAKEIR